MELAFEANFILNNPPNSDAKLTFFVKMTMASG